MGKRKIDTTGSKKPSTPGPGNTSGPVVRAVYACKRCRAKKIKCDLNFPSCDNCTKRGLTCVGLDPTTGREVPRTYTSHLEDRIASLELILRENGITTAVGSSVGFTSSAAAGTSKSNNVNPTGKGQDQGQESGTNSNVNTDPSHLHIKLEGPLDVNSLLNERTIARTDGAPLLFLEPLKLGISFARLMYTAVKVNKKTSSKTLVEPMDPAKTPAGPGHVIPGTSMHTSKSPSIPSHNSSLSNILNHNEDDITVNPRAAAATSNPSRVVPEIATSSVIDPSNQDILPAILPPKSTAQEFMKVFFAQLNPQMPIIHREEFIRTCFVPVYGPLDQGISLASNYTAINYDESVPEIIPNEEDTWFYHYRMEFERHLQNQPLGTQLDAAIISLRIVPPPKFHKPLYFLNMIFAIASSVHHLQYPTTISFAFRTAAMKYVEPVYTLEDPLESLQGILLLALYLIMRPAVPGVWYVLGLALRVVVDLGLHQENERNVGNLDPFTKDKRRRLFWCTYALDRQICFYLDRPIGISDDSINTPFPLDLDDALIVRYNLKNNQKTETEDKYRTPKDYLMRPVSGVPTYKVVSLAFFRIRQIQLEVQRILYTRAELPRKYATLQGWKQHMLDKLNRWKYEAPKTQRTMNSDFNLEFFNLNYNHTVIMLHGILPANYRLSEEDFQRVLEAAKELIHGYHKLYTNRSINYTWAAVHNLFMAGSLYLYTVYYCAPVRERNLFYEVKKITQECITTLSSLTNRCEAASSCRETFEVLTAAVVKLRYGEVVHGVTGNHTNIAKLILMGNLNKHLEQLVEKMQQEESQIQNNTQPDNNNNHNKNDNNINNNNINNNNNYKNPGMARFNLNPFRSPRSEAVLPNEDSASNVADFEWVTNSEADKKTGRAADDLDTFFEELENLSPHSFEPSAHISGSPRDNSFVPIEQTPDHSYSPASLEYTQLTLSTPSVKRQESLRVYELIHQMPTEAIWDQFFTTAYSTSLPTLP